MCPDGLPVLPQISGFHCDSSMVILSFIRCRPMEIDGITYIITMCFTVLLYTTTINIINIYIYKYIHVLCIHIHYTYMYICIP